MLLVALNLLLAGYMAGVGWLVERVVYPQFAAVPGDRWATHHAAHTSRITPVVAGPVLAQPLVAVALLAAPPAGVPRPALVAGVVLTAALLAATAAVFAPLHGRLAAGPPEPALLQRLARLNRLRTAAWTAQAAVALWIALAAT